MDNLLKENKKMLISFSFIAIILLLTTWYTIKIQGIALTDTTETEEVNEIEFAQVDSELRLDNKKTDIEIKDELEDKNETETKIDNKTEEQILYPSQNFESDEIPKITVKASVDENVFPEGTIMKVKLVSSKEKEKIKAKIENNNDKEEVVDMLAVDITFYHNGKEIQPKDGKKVNVSIITEDTVSGKKHKAVHIEDTGKVEEIKDAKVNSKGANLKAESFSIYAIIGTDYIDDNVTPTARYKYIFKVGTQIVSTQIVKNGDNLVEPSIPDWSTQSNKVFSGWRIDGETANINFLNTITIPNTETTDKTFIVFPYFEEQYRVVFYKYNNESNATIENTLVVTNGETVDLTNEILSDAADLTFIGWYLDGDPTKTKITSITVSGSDIYLRPLYSDLYIRLQFNSMGGSYVESELIIKGTNANEPSQLPQKPGYTFKGWYTSQNSAENLIEEDKFNFETTISSNKVLYAGWEAQIVNYKIIYWLENTYDDEYSYYDSKTKQGLIGTDAVFDENADKITIMKAGYQLYYYNNTKTAEWIANNSVTIKADGSTVINVYYYRFYINLRINFYGTEKTYRCKDNQIIPYETLKQDFPDIDDDKNYICTKNWACGETETSTMTLHTVGVSINAWTTVGILGGESYYHDFSEMTPTNYPCKYKLYIEKLSGGSLNNKDTYEPYSDKEIDILYYWQSNNHLIYGRKIEGFEVYGYNLNNQVAITPYPDSGLAYPFGNTLNEYFKRIRNNITFNTNGGPEIAEIRDVPYGMPLSNYSSNISGYVVDESAYTDIYGKTQTFRGWYTNPGFTGEPFDFSAETTEIMSTIGINLYAKWEPVSFNVTFKPDNGTENQVIRVESGENVNVPINPTKEGYIFLGWKKPNGTYFDFNAPITSDIELTASWSDINCNIYSVVYDAGDYGTFDLVDTTIYAGNSFAIILGTPTVIDESKYFEGWYIGNTLYKTGTFKIRSEDADEHNVITLTASYVDIPEKTKIIYDANGGNGTVYFDTTEINNNDTTTVLQLSTTGFSAKSLDTFICWNTKADGSGQNFYPGETVAVNNTDGVGTTLYAVWGRTVIVNKNDNQCNLISGAVFKITRGNQVIYISDTTSTSAELQALYGDIADGNGNGILNFNSLMYSTNITNPEFVYVLEEINSPNGYYKFETPIRFCITRANGVHILNYSEVSNFVTLDNENTTINVKNIPYLTLPKTGGIGNYVFYIIGIGLMISTITVAIYKKKVYENIEIDN